MTGEKMTCPKCNKALTIRAIKDVQVHECKGCGGIWFAHDELKQVKDRIDANLNWMDFEFWKHTDRFKVADEKNDCPACSRRMDVLEYDTTGVEVDSCSHCRGVWLDQDELRKIIDALEEEVLTKSMEDYVIATLAEARDLITHPESFLSEWREFTTLLRFLQYRILSLHPTVNEAIVRFQENPLNR